jgi:hypothetical protein
MSNQTDSFPSPSNTLEDNVRSIMDDEISEDILAYLNRKLQSRGYCTILEKTIAYKYMLERFEKLHNDLLYKVTHPDFRDSKIEKDEFKKDEDDMELEVFYNRLNSSEYDTYMDGNLVLVDEGDEEGKIIIFEEIGGETLLTISNEDKITETSGGITLLSFDDGNEYFFQRKEKLTLDDIIPKEEFKIDTEPQEMPYVYVMVYDRGKEIPEEIFHFRDDGQDHGKAEAIFLEKCSQYINGFDEHIQEYMDEVVERGYEEGNRWKIVIHRNG